MLREFQIALDAAGSFWHIQAGQRFCTEFIPHTIGKQEFQRRFGCLFLNSWRFESH